MNVAAAGMVGIYLLEKGGLQAVTDTRTLLGVFRGIQGGHLKAMDAMSDANLDAAARVLKLLVAAVQDPNEKSEIVTLVKSLS